MGGVDRQDALDTELTQRGHTNAGRAQPLCRYSLHPCEETQAPQGDLPKAPELEKGRVETRTRSLGSSFQSTLQPNTEPVEQ